MDRYAMRARERERFGKVLREEMDEADGPEIIE